jgi:1-acyl-sn-glycerol-3-phosphate acyltransferase
VNRERSFTVFGVDIPAPHRGVEALRTALSVCTWSVLGATSVAGFGLQLPLAIASAPFDETRRLPGTFVRRLGRFIAQLNPMWDFRVHGELPDYVPSKTVIISNHVSNSDAFLLCYLPWEMKYLGKKVLFYIPFVGWLMWLAGDVPVKRGKRNSITEAMELCKAHLHRGMPVMIFPEGTRSRTGDLLPFKTGAFRLAIETGADILPIAVAGTRDALPKHSWKFGFARGLVKVGEPIPTKELGIDDVDTLKERARGVIADMYAEIAPLVAT